MWDIFFGLGTITTGMVRFNYIENQRLNKRAFVHNVVRKRGSDYKNQGEYQREGW